MPYVTRDMANYAKEKGIHSDMENDDMTNVDATSCMSESDARKLREQPFSVAPTSENEGQSSSAVASSQTSCDQKPRQKSRSQQRSNAGSSASRASSMTGRRKSSTKSVAGSSGVKLSTRYESPNKDLSFNEKMIRYTFGLLRSNIIKLYEMEGSANVDRSKEFKGYKIDYNIVLVTKQKDSDRIVKTTHKNEEFREFPLCCKVYDLSRRPMDPIKSDYLKILRSLARKHPSIIQTWGIFYDSKQQQILIIQEYLCHGSMETYLKVKNYPCFDEKKASEIAQQLAMALDFLGDMGISHRSLSPRYIMIAHREPVRVKLAGFRSAMIYWDIRRENVNLVPCVALADRPPEPEFQAPEVYGDAMTEAFDPVHADIWSFGASIYYILTKKYPYDFSRENPRIEEEIQTNVRQTKTSSQCQNFLSRILCSNADQRIKFDKITGHPWIMK
uniref:Aurora kinase-like n=1 Tax=Dermatophagoides pteronyssinus TaxID=6956 RepID=A0A6P6XVB8_DERPT|nr:aurora kinase-like [Dermatophagoides pteronyssinus]